MHFYKKQPKEKKKSEKPELYDILKRINVNNDQQDGVHHLVTKIINDDTTDKCDGELCNITVERFFGSIFPKCCHNSVSLNK